MLTLTLALLFTTAAIATGLSLLDSWLRGRKVYCVLKREKALLDAGFVPQVHAHEVRLRKPAKRSLSSIKRARARRVPLPVFDDAELAGSRHAA